MIIPQKEVPILVSDERSVHTILLNNIALLLSQVSQHERSLVFRIAQAVFQVNLT